MARSRFGTNQFFDADVMSEAEHDAWIHTDLTCSGTVTINDAPVMISGTGDIYCRDLYASDNSIYLGDTKLSADQDGKLLVNDELPAVAAETTGYTGTVSVITDLTAEGVATKKYLIYEDGLLTTVSGNEQIELSGLSIL